MPARKPRKPLYPKWKADLKARGIKRKPLFTKRNKPRSSIPEMYPEIKGAHASRYTRKTEGGLAPIRGPRVPVFETRLVRTAGGGFAEKRQIGLAKGKITGYREIKPVIKPKSKSN